MISSQQLIERIQKNVGIPWQSQQSDAFSDGILFGIGETTVTGIVTAFTPTLEVLRKAVNSGKNVVICREAPSYSRGERAPAFWRNGPAPSKELLDNDAVWRAKQELISRNNVVIIRFFDNWDARKTDGQLRGLSRALGWDSSYVGRKDAVRRIGGIERGWAGLPGQPGHAVERGQAGVAVSRSLARAPSGWNIHWMAQNHGMGELRGAIHEPLFA